MQKSRKKCKNYTVMISPKLNSVTTLCYHPSYLWYKLPSTFWPKQFSKPESLFPISSLMNHNPCLSRSHFGARKWNKSMWKCIAVSRDTMLLRYWYKFNKFLKSNRTSYHEKIFFFFFEFIYWYHENDKPYFTN